MASPRVIIVGAGPAGVRAAQTLVAHGITPIVIDEAERAGGQIYRRQPANFSRTPEQLYGPDAAKASALHAAFDALVGQIDYRANTLAWALRDNTLHISSAGVASALPFDALILATGATDRLVPIAGWTLPGCYSLGGAQIAMKAQACSIGTRVVFMGTGPLLYLVAWQYVKAGVKVAAVLDTSPFGAQLRALGDLGLRPGLLSRGVRFQMRLRAAGVHLANGVTPLAVEGTGEVTGVRYRTARGAEVTIACDAVGMGYHLRPETQLADLAKVPFAYDDTTRQWLPEADLDGRTPVPGIYVAGDGARILGADAAEIAGQLAARAALADAGITSDAAKTDSLRQRHAVLKQFARGLATAFPWPAHLAATSADSVMVCRCEAITAGDIRDAAGPKDAPELNRAKALSRIGMGRCQGRFCGPAAAEILAAARGVPVREVGRLRSAAPVKPLTMATIPEPSA